MGNGVTDGLLGIAVGDALGVPVEFMSRSTLKENPVTGMRAFGTHQQRAGTWSDDSSLTFCLAESLCHGFDPADMAGRFCDWYTKGYWTPYGHVFDIGIATRDAISRLLEGCAPEKAGGTDENSNGNGSLMRILPLAFYFLKEPAARVQKIHQVSCLTHCHPRSLIGCSLYVETALNLIQGREPVAALKEAVGFLQPFYSNPPFKTELNHYKRVLDGSLPELPEEEIRSGGYVVHTLEAALWCLFKYNSFEETLLAAVNLGDDTDTVGAVAGGLAGIYYGTESIPPEWIDILAKKEEILDLCGRLEKKLFF